MSPRLGWILSLLVVFLLILAACAGGETATEAPAVEDPAVEAPAVEEEAAEPTEAPVEEEAEATETPAAEEEAVDEEAEATETPAAEEEAEAMETPAADEEAEATETPAAEEEAEATAEPEEEAAALGSADHGAYIMTLAGCGCHFNRDEGALAGGNRFETPFGVVHAANITSDPDTGIGNWSEQEIADALRFGIRPDGEQLVPVMPYRRFSVLSDEEALSVAARLLSLDPVVNEVPERELTTDLEPFTPDVAPPAAPPTDPVDRGEQLVIVANCTGCHTPTDANGDADPDLYLAGAPLLNDDDEISANITPHDDTGIGTWSEEEIAEYMHTGNRPDGSLASGSMADAIDQRFSTLTEEDALAIAAYLKSIPAIDHDPYAE